MEDFIFENCDNDLDFEELATCPVSYELEEWLIHQEAKTKANEKLQKEFDNEELPF